tara:strand:- start:130 stop:411 length:282 start_codon:yes stop_codon:yes gene_type:complete
MGLIATKMKYYHNRRQLKKHTKKFNKKYNKNYDSFKVKKHTKKTYFDKYPYKPELVKITIIKPNEPNYYMIRNPKIKYSYIFEGVPGGWYIEN